jgi:hypothetical protein
MSMKQSLKWELAGETKLHEENLSLYHFVSTTNSQYLARAWTLATAWESQRLTAEITAEVTARLSAVVTLFIHKVWTLSDSWTFLNQTRTKTQTPWPESESELYRPSDRRLSAKLVSTFADREVSRSQRGGSSTVVI